MQNFRIALLAFLFLTAGTTAAPQRVSNVAPARPLRLGREDANTFVGILSDSHCSAKHDMDSDKTSAGCTRACVRDGARYVIVAGNRVYTLDGDNDTLSPLAGQKAKVTGVLAGNVIKVNSVTAAQ
jgi:hypothetical protein